MVKIDQNWPELIILIAYTQKTAYPGIRIEGPFIQVGCFFFSCAKKMEDGETATNFFLGLRFIKGDGDQLFLGLRHFKLEASA